MDTGKTCYLFFDFDGTVATKGRIPEKNCRVLLRMKELGHCLILCTGRSWGYLQTAPEYQKIPWDGFLLGGSDLVWQGECFRRRFIRKKSVLRLANFALRTRATITFEGVQGYYEISFVGHEQPYTREELRDYREQFRAIVEKDRITKMSISPCLLPIPKVDVEFLLHGESFGEFGCKGCTKGDAILRFCRRLNIPLSQCMAFGDSLNDLSMFEVARTSVCMAHSPEALLRKASYIARSRRCGVAEGLLHYFGEEMLLTDGGK